MRVSVSACGYTVCGEGAVWFCKHQALLEFPHAWASLGCVCERVFVRACPRACICVWGGGCVLFVSLNQFWSSPRVDVCASECCPARVEAL